MTTEPHKRRWFQFRLRTMFFLVAVLAVPLAWLAHERSKVRERNEWLKQRAEFIGSVGPPDQPTWLRTFLGDDSIARVVELHFRSDASDSDLVYLSSLTRIQWLDLSDTRVTDAGLVHLQGLANLQQLNLEGTRTTPEGRQKLRQALPKTDIYPKP